MYKTETIFYYEVPLVSTAGNERYNLYPLLHSSNGMSSFIPLFLEISLPILKVISILSAIILVSLIIL